MRRLLIALAIVLGLSGLGTLGTQIGTTSLTLPQPIGIDSALAAYTDGCTGAGYMLWAPQASGGTIAYKGGFGCGSSYIYKATLYLCGGVNGNGYCANGRSWTASGRTCCHAFPSQFCTVRYSGPYWLYAGIKVEDLTVYGTWGDARWFYGPGAWVQGSC